MNLFNELYLNFFSLGDIVIGAFGLFLAFFFLSIPGKSKATFHLGMAFLLLGAMQLPYFACYSLYDPLAGYFRWTVMTAASLWAIQFIIFLVYFPDQQNPGTARRMMMILYGLAVIMTVIYIHHTQLHGVWFSFDDHSWDVHPGFVPVLASLLLVVLVLLCPCIAVWRAVKSRGEERRRILIIALVLTSFPLVSMIFNMLSRAGLTSREIYKAVFDLSGILGPFVLLISYLNRTKEKNTFMGKIIGISFVAFLVIFQLVNYVVMTQKEESYDTLKRYELKLAVSGLATFSDIRYVTSYLSPCAII